MSNYIHLQLAITTHSSPNASAMREMPFVQIGARQIKSVFVLVGCGYSPRPATSKTNVFKKKKVLTRNTLSQHVTGWLAHPQRNEQRARTADRQNSLRHTRSHRRRGSMRCSTNARKTGIVGNEFWTQRRRDRIWCIWVDLATLVRVGVESGGIIHRRRHRIMGRRRILVCRRCGVSRIGRLGV